MDVEKEKIKWIKVTDKMEQVALLDLCDVKLPLANNFTFWQPENNKEKWGLTIKNVPVGGKISEHLWKMTWTNDNYKGESKLRASKQTSAFAKDVVGQNYETIKKIYEDNLNKK